MPKMIAFDQEAQEAIRRGVSKLARAVSTRRLDTLEKKLKDIRKRARSAFEKIVSPK